MNEDQIGEKTKDYLDYGTQKLDAGTAARLGIARRQAMARFEARRSTVGLALAGHGHGQRFGHPGHLNPRVWAPAAVLALGLLLTAYWAAIDHNSDAGDIDTLLLADDLPVQAYLDHRFDAWLTRSE